MTPAERKNREAKRKLAAYRKRQRLDTARRRIELVESAHGPGFDKPLYQWLEFRPVVRKDDGLLPEHQRRLEEIRRLRTLS